MALILHKSKRREPCCWAVTYVGHVFGKMLFGLGTGRKDYSRCFSAWLSEWSLNWELPKFCYSNEQIIEHVTIQIGWKLESKALSRHKNV